MPRISRFGLSIAILVLAAAARGQDVASALAPLQGRWVVTAGEHNGRPMDAIKGGILTIAGDRFEIRTASGNVLQGTLTVDASTRPFQMDLRHADGTHWEAIYEVAADTLRLNYVDAEDDDPRPTRFSTSADTEESLVTLQRSAP